MPSWLLLAQLAFALFVVGVVVERVYSLCFRDATSEEGLRWVLRVLEQNDREAASSWARQRPRSHIARVIACALHEHDGEQDLRELLADLREEASARLRLLRVSATLASTTGLLGGILRLARGPAKVLGLSALRAGEAERMMVMEAIATMAIGVALSALCFQALALLRPAARQLISQAQRVARAVSLREEAWLLG